MKPIKEPPLCSQLISQVTFLQVRRKWNDIFKLLKEKTAAKNSLSANVIPQICRNTLQTKVREFVITRNALQEILKVLQANMKRC